MSNDKQYEVGDTASCRACGQEIICVGSYWRHVHVRHLALPVEDEPSPMPGCELIALERGRQIEDEGWSPEHDDQWVNDELVRAAVYYALPRRHDVLIAWPWAEAWNKKDKHSRIRQLEIAGALIAAEIDRLQRLGEE